MGHDAETQTGTIRKLTSDKGFGFIQLGKESYFFHRSSVRGGAHRFDDLREGDVVSFIAGERTEKGERADRVWKD